MTHGMNRSNDLCLLLMMCSLGSLLSGCAIKPAPVSTRHFVLAPISAADHVPTTAQPAAVEVGFVMMPPYLLRDSMVVRKSAEEVQFLETALWSERLDQSFRHTLAENLLLLLSSDSRYLSAPQRNSSVVRVSVNVQQFDVDTEGRGTLRGVWRLTAAGADTPLKIGQVNLTRPGPPPRGNPQTVAATLSALLADFSREVLHALAESAQARQ